jgi:levansucrase
MTCLEPQNMLTANDRNRSADQVAGSRWSARQLVMIADAALPEAPVIGANDAQPLFNDLTLWDIWPVQYDDGQVADVGGGSLWIMLSAPRRDDPNLRHNEARMRLLHCVGEQWHDCGNVFPDEFAPGSREWSGSTRIDPDSGRVTTWFTATGRRDNLSQDFEQRLFHASGQLNLDGAHPVIGDWQALTQSVINDGAIYADLAVEQGVAGLIKGFRDPYWFRDPADGKGYILFTGSKPAAVSESDYNGVIGIAAAADDNVDGTGQFHLLPPLVDADGVANELERPHVFVHGGLYYLFWSSQSQVFLPGGPKCPTGLYGMVAPSLFGPYIPLNNSSLVLANPATEPRQAYAWQVVPSLEIYSFVDFWGVAGRDIDADPKMRSSQFGGTIAPVIKIALDGNASWIVPR